MYAEMNPKEEYKKKKYISEELYRLAALNKFIAVFFVSSIVYLNKISSIYNKSIDSENFITI